MLPTQKRCEGASSTPPGPNWQRAQRRALHNKLMELQGNIRVIARCRPPAPFETAGGDADVVLFPDAQGELTVRNEAGSPHAFEFDSVFAPGSTQGEVFDAVKPMITSALDGYPSCIFAYGQTGSGKTHTMEGPLEDRGVYFRALAELFEFRDEKGQPLQITLSMLEIYNETIRDLLVLKTGGQPKLEIRQTQTGHNVPGLTQVRVATQDEVTNVVGKGSAQRTVGGHDMNEHSSRSHLIISLDIAGRGKLNLVDLAGSERLSKTNATGDRLKEAQAINKSLSALGDVIQALSKKNGHVPYRNSKLTYLLQDSLSVSAKVMMVVAVSPNESNASETICSLNFASRCRDVALGGKSASIELDKAKKTIRMLQAKLATLTS
ncbi:P-loop containing nucleoside triphosphate hydrolase protein [Pelagophyceae sp. CCMP2097]|nr:P-loop containing nucleoside triphosphate hydrolase protein [Pelagophyceae sp. CCMP2097]